MIIKIKFCKSCRSFIKNAAIGKTKINRKCPTSKCIIYRSTFNKYGFTVYFNKTYWNLIESNKNIFSDCFTNIKCMQNSSYMDIKDMPDEIDKLVLSFNKKIEYEWLLS